jgi:hypothetical protein
MMKPASFFGELRRRNVYKVAVAYAVVSWLLVQAASILLPTFEAPGWVMKAFVVFIAFGFVLCVIISWAFEATPDGLKRTRDVSPDVIAKLLKWSARKFGIFVAIVAVIAAGLLGYQVWRAKIATPRHAAIRAAADAALADLIANGRDQLAYQIAEVYAVRGEKEKAFEWLQISLDTHDTGTLGILVVPLLHDLRSDPRYKALLTKLGMPTQ